MASETVSPEGTDSVEIHRSLPAIPKWTLRAVESAGFVAIVSAIFYYMGYRYYSGFFSRLVFPSPFPELSTTDYVIHAFSTLSGVALLIGMFDNFSNRLVEPNSISQAWRVNAPFVIFPLLLLEWAYLGGYLNTDVAIRFGIVIIAAIGAILLKRSLVRLYASPEAGYGFLAMVGYCLFFIYSFGAYFAAMGESDAKGLIEGKRASTTAIVQTADVDSPINLVPLIVALDRGDRLYLVQQESPGPDFPTVYVVPYSDIQAVTMRRTGDPSIAPGGTSTPVVPT